jgi:hypothetical protein
VQIVLGILIAAVIGVAVHYALPQKLTRGAALAPLLAAAVGAISWMALTWAGLGPDNLLLWLAAVAVPAIVTVPVIAGLAASRTRADAAARERLRIR